MKNIILGACLLAALATTGCKKKKTTPPPPELSVTLVDPGEAPLESLRYAIPPDMTVRTLLDIRDTEATREETEDSADAFGVLPGLKLLMHAGPTVPLPKGTRYVLRIAKAESVLPEGVTERQMKEVEQGVEALRGMRGRFEQPSFSRVFPLQCLQYALVVMVGRGVGCCIEPLRVGGYVEHSGKCLGCKLLHEQRSAFFGSVEVEGMQVAHVWREEVLEFHQVFSQFASWIVCAGILPLRGHL